MIELVCPCCGSTKIDQYRMSTGPIWCQNCYTCSKHKERFNPFVVENQEGEEEHDISTFSRFGKYLAQKEDRVRNAVSNALNPLYVPWESDGGVEVRITLTEATNLEESQKRAFIVQDVDINVGLEF